MPAVKITQANVLKLSLPMRLAWATAVVEKVERLFSSYFRQHHLQDAAIKAAWSAAKGKLSTSAAEKLINEIGTKVEEADLEGYGYTCVSPPLEVLLEFTTADTRNKNTNLVGAIEAAARSYACLALFKQNVHAGDPAVPRAYIEAQQARVWKLAQTSLAIAAAASDIDAAITQLAKLELSLDYEPLDPSVVRRRRKDLEPPPLELAAAPAGKVRAK